MAGRAHGEVAPSPWVSRFADYQDNAITLTVNFNEQTRAVLNASVERDAACVYTRILFGRGEDGTPDSTTNFFEIPAGPSSIGRGVLLQHGFDLIEDMQTLQITAGR
jgi:hypothetical protein